MVWSKDLAKLKQDLRVQDENDPAPPPARPVKSKPPTAGPKSLEEEDALFLAAIGKSLTVAPKAYESLEGDGDFIEAMSQLKGIKPTRSDIPASSEMPWASNALGDNATAPQNAIEIQMEDISIASEIAAYEASEGHKRSGCAEPIKITPEKIQLAAGMVIEVDGVLDLRNHNAEDALERLKERVYDGAFLGWRTLHVILGNSESLHSVFLDYIDSPQSSPLTKYAQAPLPMGGAQAWILYFVHKQEKP